MNNIIGSAGTIFNLQWSAKIANDFGICSSFSLGSMITLASIGFLLIIIAIDMIIDRNIEKYNYFQIFEGVVGEDLAFMSESKVLITYNLHLLKENKKDISVS